MSLPSLQQRQELFSSQVATHSVFHLYLLIYYGKIYWASICPYLDRVLAHRDREVSVNLMLAAAAHQSTHHI